MPTYACAHHGDNWCAPENTLPAFALAIQKGAHQLEFDLRVTRDEQLIGAGIDYILTDHLDLMLEVLEAG